MKEFSFQDYRTHSIHWRPTEIHGRNVIWNNLVPDSGRDQKWFYIICFLHTDKWIMHEKPVHHQEPVRQQDQLNCRHSNHHHSQSNCIWCGKIPQGETQNLQVQNNPDVIVDIAIQENITSHVGNHHAVFSLCHKQMEQYNHPENLLPWRTIQPKVSLVGTFEKNALLVVPVFW